MNFGRWKGFVNRYIVNAVILVIAWGGMFRRSFNCDTLAHMLNNSDGGSGSAGIGSLYSAAVF